MRVAGVALLVALVVGCTTAELNRIDPQIADPPCDGQNPYKCPDGHSCCKSWKPVCWGPDAEGYYCQPRDFDPEDPGGVLYGAQQHRERATKRVDE